MTYVGKNTIRSDGYDKVTGAAKYTADYSMDGMLFVCLVRSTMAHAEILSIDTAEAEKSAYVYTYKDLAENVIADIVNDAPALAEKKVRYIGEPIAVVAADSLKKAKKAAAMVKVEYRELTVMTEPEDALSENAVNIHEGGNKISEFENTKGVPSDGFAAADLVLEHTYTTPYQEHAYMEPDANFSYMEDGILTVITAGQNVFHDKRMICKAVGLSDEQVRVISGVVGGAFGGKDGHITQIFGSLVTYKTGKPAKIVLDRSEVIAYTYKRHAIKVKLRMGFAKDGTILAFDSNTLINTGAYIGYGLTVLGLYSEHAAGPYKIDNVHIHSALVYTNRTPASAFRGFGAPQGAFARESMITEAASLLGLDPIDIRIKNAMHTGDETPIGNVMTGSCKISEALQMLKETELWKNKAREEGIGYGVAAGHLSCGFGKGIPDACTIDLVNNNGTFEIYLGLNDIGQGSVQSVAAIAADALGVGIEKVRLIQGDTAKTYDCGSTAASRSTFLAGNAVIKAAKEYREREAKGETNIKVHSVSDFPETDVMKAIGMPHSAFTYCAQAAKVRVDKVSGKIDILDMAAVTEAGKIINPMQFAGQICGGMVQSLGYAISEDCRYTPEGRLLNDSFATYIIPTMADVPQINTYNVDAYEPTGPMGAKGAAEAPTVPFAGAVNSAVYDATNYLNFKLPISAEDIVLQGGV